MADILVTSTKVLNPSGFGQIGFLFSGRTITNFVGSLITASNALATINVEGGASFRSLESQVVGDINGDGRDDVLFGNSGNLVSIAGVPSGTPFFSGIRERSDTELPIGVSISNVLGSTLSPFALGDLNRDGFDDFALSDQPT